MDALFHELQKITGTGFLVSKTGMRWDWERATPGSINKYDYDLAGTMPLRQKGDTEPSYEPGQELSNAYDTVLYAINRGSSATHDQQLKKINNELSSYLVKKRQDFLTYKALKAKEASKPGFDEEEWKSGMGWDVKLKRYDGKIKDLQREIGMFEVNDPIYKKIREALSERENFLTRIQDGVEVPPCIITANGPEWATSVAEGQGNRVTIQLKSSKGHEHKSQVGGSFNAGVKLFSFIPFGVKGGVSGSKENVKLEKEATDISITFEAFETFSVNRGKWFNMAYLKKIASENRWEAGHTTDEMLGRDGILHSVVTGFVAAYRPSLTITASKSANNEVKKNLEAKLGLSIGPVFFEGGAVSGGGSLSGGGSSATYDFQEEGQTITIKSKANYPQILGVIVANPLEM